MSWNVNLKFQNFIQIFKKLSPVFFFWVAFLHNFAKQSLVNTTYDYEYDYMSIMHYGTHFFRYLTVFHMNTPWVK
jgi:hypothetical protein